MLRFKLAKPGQKTKLSHQYQREGAVLDCAYEKMNTETKTSFDWNTSHPQLSIVSGCGWDENGIEGRVPRLNLLPVGLAHTPQVSLACSAAQHETHTLPPSRSAQLNILCTTQRSTSPHPTHNTFYHTYSYLIWHWLFCVSLPRGAASIITSFFAHLNTWITTVGSYCACICRHMGYGSSNPTIYFMLCTIIGLC